MSGVIMIPDQHISFDETTKSIISYDMGGCAANCFNHYLETGDADANYTVINIIVDLDYIYEYYPDRHQDICNLFKLASSNKFKEFTCKIEYFDGKIENINGVIDRVFEPYTDTLWIFRFKTFKINLKYRRIKTITFKK